MRETTLRNVRRIYQATSRRAFRLARFAAPRALLPIVDRTQVLLAELELLTSGETPERNQKMAEDGIGHEAGTESTPFYKPGDESEAAGLAPLIAHALCRPSVDLHGDWDIIIDQANLGDVNPMMHGGVGRGESHAPSELLEYSFDGGDTLRVPGDWNTQKPELFWYRGVVWYRRIFRHSTPQNQRTLLYFGGANFHKKVYLNGRLLARHTGGFTPFNIDISAHLRDGDNTLIVKVDSRSHAREVPTEYNDWLNYGGITREVLLIDVPESYIEWSALQLAPGHEQRLRFKLQLRGPQAYRATVRLEIPELGIKGEFQANGEGFVSGDFASAPELWSPAKPRRYAVTIRAINDVIEDRIGFRRIESHGGQIRLNGEPIYLRGISLHEESLIHTGRAWGDDDAQRTLAELRALKVNFVRLAHYPHNEHIVRACDEAGILVWSELPVYHSIAFDKDATLASAKSQFHDVIRRDRNRACVILWSIANETEPGAHRDHFLVNLAHYVRQQDDTRLLTAALHGNDQMRHVAEQIAMQMIDKVDAALPPPPITISDPLQNALDVIGFNEYFGWYTCAPLTRELRKRGITIEERDVRRFMLEKMPELRIRAASGKPILISELGAEAVAGLRADPDTVFSEEYQAEVYRKQIALLAANPSIQGVSPWILKDFRSPYRLHTKLQQYWNRKGLVDEFGTRKMAFSVLADWYQQLAEAPRGIAHTPPRNRHRKKHAS